MISDSAWTVFASYMKITQRFNCHPFEIMQNPTTKQITFRITTSKFQFSCCVFLSVYVFIDAWFYDTIAMCFYYKSDSYADFIKNYTHLITRCASSVINLVFIYKRKVYAEYLSTLSAVFVKEIQDDQETLSSVTSRKLTVALMKVFTAVIFVQSLVLTIAYINDIPTIRFWHSIAFPPDRYWWLVPIMAFLEFWIGLCGYTFGGLVAFIFIFSFNTMNLWLEKLSRNLTKTTAVQQKADKAIKTDKISLIIYANYQKIQNGAFCHQQNPIRNSYKKLWLLAALKILALQRKQKQQQRGTSFLKDILLSYRSIQLLTKQCNTSINSLWTIGHTFLLICIIFTNCGSIILFSHQTEKLQFFLLLIGSVLLHLIVAWTYPAAGRIYESSRMFQKRCAKNIEDEAFGSRTLRQRYAKSCRPFGIWVGSLYKQSSITTLVFLHTAFNYTVTVLLIQV